MKDMKNRVDLNCDMGESFGKYKLGNDSEVIKYISSANIACGFHGGDPNVMNESVKMAKKYNVKVGAHPGFPDLLGFGRRNMEIGRNDLMNLIIYQIGALNVFCQKHNVILNHVKPHGNLNNMADSDEDLAVNIVDAVQSISKELILYVKPQSKMHEVAIEKKQPILLEIFADRNYYSDYSLVPRTEDNAVISEPTMVTNRIINILQKGKVETVDGDSIEIKGETICVHGDTITALELTKTINENLLKNNFIVA